MGELGVVSKIDFEHWCDRWIGVRLQLDCRSSNVRLVKSSGQGWYLTATDQCTSFSACDLVFDFCSSAGRLGLDLGEAATAKSVVCPNFDSRPRNGTLGWKRFAPLCRGERLLGERRVTNSLSFRECTRHTRAAVHFRILYGRIVFLDFWQSCR